jgi:hypothetical protein
LNLPRAAFGVALVLSLVGSGRASASPPTNKCGCYKDTAGTCFCEKKARCGCPGDCEPKGCEEQRDKQIQKEIAAETKKAQESQSKRSDGDDDRSNENAERAAPKPAPVPSHVKLSAAQAKQLAKLLDLYLSEHPEARGKPVEDVRNDVGSR